MAILRTSHSRHGGLFSLRGARPGKLTWRQRLSAVLFLLAAAAMILLPPASASASTADHLMTGWKVEQRTQTVSIDPALETAGVSYQDVLAAFDPWNQLFLKYYGFPIFAPHYGNWWEADILIAANASPLTWVNGYWNPGYVQRGNNHSVVFLGWQDAWRNRQMLAHELGHALGLADHGDAISEVAGHTGYKPAGNYIGVMSYSTSPQSWFLDVVVPGFVVDGQLVRDYFIG